MIKLEKISVFGVFKIDSGKYFQPMTSVVICKYGSLSRHRFLPRSVDELDFLEIRDIEL